MVSTTTPCPTEINCACLIHDKLYDWQYVDKLYSSLQRNLTPRVILHVYTEPFRKVPAPYIKHNLVEWPGIRGPRQSWWYKIQLFNADYYSGPMLYLDLDTVITGNLDWIWHLDLTKFWYVRDFQYLFRPYLNTVNSSVMWFDTAKFSNVFTDFDHNVLYRTNGYKGDQDYIDRAVTLYQRQAFDTNRVKSWRWQVADGGFDLTTAKPLSEPQPTVIDSTTSLLIFHGNPKPHEIIDNNLRQYWS